MVRAAVGVAPELDLSVGNDRERPGQLRCRLQRCLSEPQLLGEVVAQPGQRAGADQAGHIARVAPERGVEGPLRARVEAWVPALAGAAQVGVTEPGVRRGARGRGPHGGLGVTQRVARRAPDVAAGRQCRRRGGAPVERRHRHQHRAEDGERSQKPAHCRLRHCV